MNTDDLSPVNEWNHYHDAYVARPLSDYGDSAEDWTNGMTALLSPVPNRNGYGQLQDRATRLLVGRQASTARKVRV
jgi:hypothetical protein